MPTSDTERLVALFRRERATFAQHSLRAGLTELWVTNIRCLQPGFCAFRDVAYARPDLTPPRIVVSARLSQFPDATIVGILRHEFGHIVDTVPYVINTGGEQRADDIAEAVTGQKIYYDARDMQTTVGGTYPRPRNLHW